VASTTGELDVGFCLYRIGYVRPDLYGAVSLEISKPDESLFETEILSRQGDAWFSRRVAISDFLIEVSF
jgi:hypothetical protein